MADWLDRVRSMLERHSGGSRDTANLPEPDIEAGRTGARTGIGHIMASSNDRRRARLANADAAMGKLVEKSSILARNRTLLSSLPEDEELRAQVTELCDNFDFGRPWLESLSRIDNWPALLTILGEEFEIPEELRGAILNHLVLNIEIIYRVDILASLAVNSAVDVKRRKLALAQMIALGPYPSYLDGATKEGSKIKEYDAGDEESVEAHAVDGLALELARVFEATKPYLWGSGFRRHVGFEELKAMKPEDMLPAVNAVTTLSSASWPDEGMRRTAQFFMRNTALETQFVDDFMLAFRICASNVMTLLVASVVHSGDLELQTLYEQTAAEFPELRDPESRVRLVYDKLIRERKYRALALLTSYFSGPGFEKFNVLAKTFISENIDNIDLDSRFVLVDMLRTHATDELKRPAVDRLLVLVRENPATQQWVAGQLRQIIEVEAQYAALSVPVDDPINVEHAEVIRLCNQLAVAA